MVDAGKVLPKGEIYALGCVVWSLVMGERPFKSDDPVQTLLTQLGTEGPPLEPPPGVALSNSFKVLVRKMTGFVPAERYASASELLEDLREVRSKQAIQGYQKQEVVEEEPKARTSSGLAILIALALLNLVLLGVSGHAVVRIQEASLPDPSQGHELPLIGVPGPKGKAGERDAKTGADAKTSTAAHAEKDADASTDADAKTDAEAGDGVQ